MNKLKNSTYLVLLITLTSFESLSKVISSTSIRKTFLCKIEYKCKAFIQLFFNNGPYTKIMLKFVKNGYDC